MDEEPQENKLEMLAAGVARGWSLSRSAREADVPKTTARRWADKPEFQQRVKALRHDMMSQTVGKYVALSGKAARRLERLIDSPDDDTAWKAIRGLNADLMGFMEKLELAAEVAELRKRFEPQNRS
jgi:hypothetical protein